MFVNRAVNVAILHRDSGSVGVTDAPVRNPIAEFCFPLGLVHCRLEEHAAGDVRGGKSVLVGLSHEGGDGVVFSGQGADGACFNGCGLLREQHDANALLSVFYPSRYRTPSGLVKDVRAIGGGEAAAPYVKLTRWAASVVLYLKTQVQGYGFTYLANYVFGQFGYDRYPRAFTGNVGLSGYFQGLSRQFQRFTAVLGLSDARLPRFAGQVGGGAPESDGVNGKNKGEPRNWIEQKFFDEYAKAPNKERFLEKVRDRILLSGFFILACPSLYFGWHLIASYNPRGKQRLGYACLFVGIFCVMVIVRNLDRLI